MKTEDRAVLVWYRLVVASATGESMTYGQVAKDTGASAQSLGSCLRPIQRYCASRELPLLSAIVVNSQSGKPGSGFGSTQDVANQQKSVFCHDWLRTRTPEPADMSHYLDSVAANPIADQED